MARRSPPRKVTYFEPIPPRLARNTIIESTFEVGRRFRCTKTPPCRSSSDDKLLVDHDTFLYERIGDIGSTGSLLSAYASTTASRAPIVSAAS